MGHLKEVKDGQGGHQVLKVFLRGANELPRRRGLKNGATLDVLQTFLKSGGLRGHIKELKGVLIISREAKCGLWAPNQLPCPRGFQNGVTLDDLETFQNQVV